jgi:hypothetical protein
MNLLCLFISQLKCDSKDPDEERRGWNDPTLIPKKSTVKQLMNVLVKTGIGIIHQTSDE